MLRDIANKARIIAHDEFPRPLDPFAQAEHGGIGGAPKSGQFSWFAGIFRRLTRICQISRKKIVVVTATGRSRNPAGANKRIPPMIATKVGTV